jgi:hypothetical protein
MVVDEKQDPTGSVEKTENQDIDIQHLRDGAINSQANAWISWSAAIVLAIFHWTLAVSSSLHNATTFDEVAHIAGGLGPITLNDYRLMLFFRACHTAFSNLGLGNCQSAGVVICFRR